jgi:inner membrane protein
VDPLTHALIGAGTARVAAGRPLGRAAWLPGIAGALLPDADAFIRSSADPLLYAEFHRHFTHALAFIPVGGAVAALPWILARGTRPRWRAYLLATTAAYATHGLLDASTTYGTLLWWPFSRDRVAWNAIAIVDPLFTLGMLAGVAAAIWFRRAAPAAAALLVCAAYLLAGTVQRDRALSVQAVLAEARGHRVERAAVFPGFGSNIAWRSLYMSGGTLYMDRIRVSWSGAHSWRPDTRARLLREQDLPREARQHPRQLRDFRRFQWFTSGWVARAAAAADVIGDARYSDAVDRFEPIWGIRLLDARANPPVAWVDRSRDRRIDPRTLWLGLTGRDPAYRPLTPAPRTGPAPARSSRPAPGDTLARR